MSEKIVLFMARTTRYYEFAQSLSSSLGVDVSAATPDSPTASAISTCSSWMPTASANDRIEQIAKWLDDRGNIPMLVMVDDDSLASLHLPSRFALRLYLFGCQRG